VFGLSELSWSSINSMTGDILSTQLLLPLGFIAGTLVAFWLVDLGLQAMGIGAGSVSRFGWRRSVRGASAVSGHAASAAAPGSALPARGSAASARRAAGVKVGRTSEAAGIYAAGMAGLAEHRDGKGPGGYERSTAEQRGAAAFHPTKPYAAED